MVSRLIRCTFGVFCALGLGLAPGRLSAEDAPRDAMSPGGMIATPHRSLPLRELLKRPDVKAQIAASQAPTTEGREINEPELPHNVSAASPRGGADGALQNNPGINQPTPTGVSFDGGGIPLFAVGVAPPDTEGRVGPNHYVQWVNLSFQIFDKSGVLLAGPFPGKILWTGFGGPCQTFNNGDPIAQYDLMADRWILTQFVVGASPAFSHQCVAVSTSGDPLGSYSLYDFVTAAAQFVDYPHWGMWPDSYYMSAHLFNTAGTAFLGQGLFSFDRLSMLAGLPAGVQGVNLGVAFGGALPSDVDSILPPPPGTPNMVLAPGSPELDGSVSPTLHLWYAQATWGGSPTFTVTQQPDIAGVASFNGQVCTNFTRNCVPQTGTTTKVDAISDRLMYRVAYRNFGDHDAIVLTHTVNTFPFANPQVNSQAAMRWYEIRSPGTGVPTLFQQGTYAPDATNFRWMGSIAMDSSGDMALGYSNSSTTISPRINVTGRLAIDAPGTMGSELLMQAGGGSQTGGLNRWGDYSAMTVDPHDGCTFWYTQEYLKANGSFNWSTRVASFAYPNCTSEAQGILSGQVTNCTTGEPVAGVMVSLSNGFSGVTDASGNYSITVTPGSYNAQATSIGRLCTASPLTPVTINNGLTTVQNFCVDGTPELKFPTITLLTEGQLPYSYIDASGDGKISPNECVSLNVQIENVGCADDTSIYGVLSTSTPGVTVDNALETWPDLPISAVGTNLQPFSFSTDNTYNCDNIDFTLTLHDAGGPAGSLPIHIAAPCPASPTPQLFSGSIANTDSTQNTRMGRFVAGTTCAGAGCPGASGGAGTRYFDSYIYTNTTGGPACITVSVTPACDPGGNPTGTIQSVAYLGSYNPASICQNYAGDWGFPGAGNPNVGQPYSFTVPPLTSFVVVVNGVAVGAVCPSYNGTVTGFVDTTPSTGVCVPCPAITVTSTPSPLPGATAGVAYAGGTISASGGTGPYTFVVTSGALPPGLTLNPSTGAISGTPTATGAFPFTVTAIDSVGCSGSAPFSITVSCGVINLAPATLPDGIVGQAYSQTLVASGGFAPYNFTLASGALPPGLTLFANGTISGTPTAGGSYNFIVTVTDANGCAGQFAYTITVVCPGTPISVSPATVPNGQVGTFYDVFFTASGGTGTYTFSSTGTLPAGTSLNSATGELSGTLTATGSFLFTITATDTNGCTGSQQYLVTVSCAAINLSPTSLPSGSVGTFYSQTITASGGSGGYVFSLGGGSLPPGLSLSVGGVLSGTPTASGSYSFVVTATDSQGCFGSSFYTLTISCAGITVSPASLPNGQLGATYSQTIWASGGTGTYTFSSTGTLPPGTSLDSTTGVLSGTLSAAGTFSFTVTATDGNGCSGSTSYIVTVSCGSITVSPASLPNAQEGVAYSQTISASGGSGSYTFSASGGVPPGLTLNPSTGVLSGTPTAMGNFLFTVTATDSNGCTGSQLYLITVSCAAINLSPTSLPGGNVGLAYSQTITASGGSAPYTFAASGSLPPGVSLSASGVLSGTPTAAGAYTFQVTATDSNGCTGSFLYTVTIGPAGSALHYYTIAPCRLVDTRPPSHAPFGGPAIGSNETRSWPWAGQCGLPSDAVAVSANITAPLPTADGTLVFYPAGVPVPQTTTIYVRLGKVRANNAQISMNGPFPGVVSVTSNIPGGSANVIVDVNGYYR